MYGTTQCYEAIERGAAELGLQPWEYVRVDSGMSEDEQGILAISFYDAVGTLVGTIEVPLEEAPE